ncbi:MAG: T9SS type A sorting domain-containing protein [Saprospiraceae bacterium]|nr:T9SS type A sorting domain-containing protein [Saprospiraceae bacterium]
MKARILTISFFLFAYLNGFSQPWVHTYSGDSLSIFEDFLVEADGSILGLISGASEVTALIRLDENGAEISRDTIESTFYGTRFVKKDGLLYCVGYRTVGNERMGYVAEVNPDGNLIWENVLEEGILESILVNEASIFVGGMAMNAPTGPAGVIFQFSRSGNIQDTLYTDFPYQHQLKSVKQLAFYNNEKIVIAGKYSWGLDGGFLGMIDINRFEFDWVERKIIANAYAVHNDSLRLPPVGLDIASNGNIWWCIPGRNTVVAEKGALVMEMSPAGDFLQIVEVSNGGWGMNPYDIRVNPDSSYFLTGFIMDTNGFVAAVQKRNAYHEIIWESKMRSGALFHFKPANDFLYACGSTPFLRDTTFRDAMMVKLSKEGFYHTNGIGFQGLYHAVDSCELIGNEVAFSDFRIKIDTSYYYPDADGFFQFYLPNGSHTAYIEAGDSVEVCTPEIEFEISDQDPDQQLNILFKRMPCANPRVSIVSAPFTRCQANSAYLYYENTGNEALLDAEIDLKLPITLTLQRASHPYTGQNGQYKFEIPVIESGEQAVISFELFLDCDAPLDAVNKISAYISPETSCDLNFEDKNIPFFSIEGDCRGDSSVFKVSNKGGDMTKPLTVKLYLNHSLVETAQILLGQEEQSVFKLASGSATATIEIVNPDNPLGDFLQRSSLEGCGTEPNGLFNTGFVDGFSSGESGPWSSVLQVRTIDAPIFNQLKPLSRGFGYAGYTSFHEDLYEYQLIWKNYSNEIVEAPSFRILPGESFKKGFHFLGSSFPLSWHFDIDGAVILENNTLQLLPGEEIIIRFALEGKDGISGFQDYNETLLRAWIKGNNLAEEEIIGHQFKEAITDIYNEPHFYEGQTLFHLFENQDTEDIPRGAKMLPNGESIIVHSSHLKPNQRWSNITQVDNNGVVKWARRIFWENADLIPLRLDLSDDGTHVIIIHQVTDRIAYGASAHNNYGLISAIDTSGHVLWSNPFYTTGLDSMEIKTVEFVNDSTIFVVGEQVYSNVRERVWMQIDKKGEKLLENPLSLSGLQWPYPELRSIRESDSTFVLAYQSIEQLFLKRIDWTGRELAFNNHRPDPDRSFYLHKIFINKEGQIVLWTGDGGDNFIYFSHDLNFNRIIPFSSDTTGWLTHVTYYKSHFGLTGVNGQDEKSLTISFMDWELEEFNIVEEISGIYRPRVRILEINDDGEAILIFPVWGSDFSFGYINFQVDIDKLLNQNGPIPADNGLIISPNPANDLITIKVPESIRNISIYRYDGLKMVEDVIITNNYVDIQNLRPGLYLLQAKSTSGTSYAGKFVKL